MSDDPPPPIPFKIDMKRAFDKIFNNEGDTNLIFPPDTPPAASLKTLYVDETPMEPTEPVSKREKLAGSEERPTKGMLSPATAPRSLANNNNPIYSTLASSDRVALPLSADEENVADRHLWSSSVRIINRDLPVDTEITVDGHLDAVQAMKWVDNILSHELLDPSNVSLMVVMNRKKHHQ